MALVIDGRIVPMSNTNPSAVFAGRIYLGDDGFVEAVTAGNAATPAGFTNAPIVDAGDAFVIPGQPENTQPAATQPLHSGVDCAESQG
jgi:imidazolonepropionase-like amidohydrolase